MITPEQNAAADQYLQSTGYTPPAQASAPANDWYSSMMEKTSGYTPPPAPEDKPGFIQGLAQGIASPFLRTSETIKRGVDTAFGDNNYAAPATDYGYFGKVSPFGVTPEGKPMGAGRTVADVAGAGAELASWLVGGGEATSVAEQVAKQNVWKAIGEAVKAGAKIGGLQGLGSSLQEQVKTGNPSVGQTALDTAIGAGAGTVMGVAGGTAAELPRLVQQLSEGGAPRVINSLIKPLEKDFSYGKNPGAAVAREGIKATSLEDLTNKISAARQKTGSQLQTALSEIPNQSVDLSKSLDYLNKAADQAAQQNDTNLLNRINNVKRALTDNLVQTSSAEGAKVLSTLDQKITDAEQSGDTKGAAALVNQKNEAVSSGVISTGQRDLMNHPLDQVPQLKQQIGDMTKWTGNRSEDNTVNAALKKTYGDVKQKMLDAVGKTNPELSAKISDLSEHYGSLLSAENAAKHRDILTQRQNFISLPSHIAALGGGIIAAISTGGAALPSLLATAGGAVVDKLLGSTAFKTNLAAALQKVADKNGINAVEQLAEKVPQLRDSIKEFLKNPKAGMSIEPINNQGVIGNQKTVYRNYLEHIENGKTKATAQGLQKKMNLQSAQFIEQGRGAISQFTPEERSVLFDQAKRNFNNELKNAKSLGFESIKDYNRAQRMLENEQLTPTQSNLSELSKIISEQNKANRVGDTLAERKVQSKFTDFLIK